MVYVILFVNKIDLVFSTMKRFLQFFFTIHQKNDFFLMINAFLELHDKYIKISLFYNLIFKITGEMGIVAGWGRLSEGGQLPSILQYVSTYFINYLK